MSTTCCGLPLGAKPRESTVRVPLKDLSCFVWIEIIELPTETAQPLEPKGITMIVSSKRLIGAKVTRRS